VGGVCNYWISDVVMIAVKFRELLVFLVRRTYNVVATFFLFTCVCGALVCAEEITMEDIIEGYKNNASQFHKARVFYETVKILHRPFQVTTESGTVLTNEDILQPTYKLDYWTNFEDLFIRGGNETEDSLVRGGHMSFDTVFGGSLENRISTIDFENTYRKIPVLTYSAQDKIVRHWLGYDTIEMENNGRSTQSIPRAFVGSTIPLVRDPDFAFPPFVPFSRENADRVFPTDAFFDAPLDDFRLLGTVTLRGETYVVLESRSTSEAMQGLSRAVVGTKYEGADIRMNNIFRAWVSVKQGCIPVRIEKSARWSVDGRLVGHEESLDMNSALYYDEVFEIQEISKVKPGVFFPTKANRKFYAFSEDSEKALSSIPRTFVDVLDGHIPNVPITMVVSREKKWEIVRVIPDVEIPSEAFSLPFPKGTVLYDERTQKTSIVGMTDAEYEQMLREEGKKSRMMGVVPDSGMEFPDPDSKWTPEDFIPRAPQGWRTAFFVIGVNLVVLALLLRYFLLSLKRRKTE